MVVDVAQYRRIFYPETVAVIGASDNVMKFGGMLLRALLGFGCKARLYPVNPKAGTIMGLPAYASLDAVPGPVDFAVLTVPAEQVMDAVKACVKKGVKGAEILTAGFRESGPEGAALERELTRTARAGGLKLIGPNCFGVYTPEAGLTLMPGGEFSREPGPVGFISQSGGGTCDAAYMARGRGVHFSVAVSYGNGCDLAAAEMLSYFEADPKTKIVGAYLEGVDDGRDFFEALKSCAAKKPVIILKGGLSEQGYRGTLGHTGSMAGTRVAWEAAIRSAGAVAARDLKDLVELLMAFNCLEGFTGGGAGILAGGGLRTVDGLDAASAYGFPVPPLDDATAARIQALLPPAGGKGANPVDLANPVMSPTVVNPIMEMLAARDDVHFLVKYQMMFYLLNSVREVRKMTGNQEFKLEYHTALTNKAREIRERTGKPLIMVLLDIASDPEHWDMELGRWEARSHFTANGIPVFDNGLQAFSVLRRVADYYRRRR
ncbi:MAG TPA: CoA-binding protein [bacterium]|nr:CoA-binding protein [bacterium]